MYGKKFSRARRRRIRRAAAAAAVVVVCVIFLLVSPVCAVKEVKMNGNFHETEEEVTGLLGRGPLSRSSVLLYLFNRGRKVSGNTFVDTLTVDLDNLHAVTVNVSEKKLIGCVEYDGRYWYFDRSGKVLVCTETDGSVMKDAAETKMSSQKTDFQETPEAAVSEQDSSEDAVKSRGQLLEKITDVFELSSGADALSGVKIIYLAADPVIYGDEYVEEDADPGEDVTGEGEVYEETPAEEYDEGADEGVSGDEWTGTEEVTGEEQEAGAETEAYAQDDAEETLAEETQEAEQSEETPAEEAEAGEIIQPSVVTEEDMPQGKDVPEAQTWDIDTSARGGNYLPVVEGLVFSEAAVGYPLPVQYDRVFSSIAVLKSFVDRSGYVPDVVSYDTDGNLKVTYGEAVINLGKGENIESRVSIMGKTLPYIAGLSGTLHLENCDGTQNRFIFSKNEKTS